MRNLKKRILSFVSAAAMVATLLPTTALFASAADIDTGLTWDNQLIHNSDTWGSAGTKTFNVSTAGTYTLNATWKGTNDGGQLKIKVNGTDVHEYWDHSGNNYWDNNYVEVTGIHLDAGTNSISFEGKYFLVYSATFTLTEADSTYDENLDVTATVMPNNASYGSVSESTLTKGGDTTVATAANGYMFVGWLIMEDDGSNKKSLSTKKTLKVTEDIATVINSYSNPDIVAQFGKKTRVRYEAEDFKDFISETKYDATHNVKEPKTFCANYDDPTQVSDNNSASGIFGSKTQTWDNTSYNDRCIAPQYSAGGAVALTGPSNGLAIPFSLSDDLDEDVEVELGYNYGSLSEWYQNNNKGEWNDWKGDFWGTGGLFVNLYYVGSSSDWNTLKSVMNAKESGESGYNEQGNWSVSGNATAEKASDFLKTYGDLAGNAFFYKLPLTDTKAHLLNSDGTLGNEVTAGTDTYEGNLTGRDTDQATTITLPAGLPAGKYFLSVATDENNYTEWDGYNYWGDGGNSDGKVNFASGATENNAVGKVGTAYYDYIQFYTASTPEMPSPIQVGANFIFKDMWGNSLSSNAFSASTYNSGKILFSPEASRYLIVQGWDFKGWDIYEGTVSFDSNGTISGTKTGTISASGNSDIDTACGQLDALQYESGSTYTFVAQYAVKRNPTPVTVTNGSIYVQQDASDTTYTHKMVVNANGTSNSFETFSNLKLVADERADETFAYWTLNGFIYSYDPTIYFMTWDAQADFVAHYSGSATTAEAKAFIDTDHVTMSGFDKAENKYHKIEFDCAYYVPDNCTYVSSGIVYTDGTGPISTVENNTTVSSTGALTISGTNANKIVVAANKKYLLFTEDSHGNKYNNQIMVSITNMGFEKTRQARAYLVYKDSNNQLQVVYSSGIVSETTPAYGG